MSLLARIKQSNMLTPTGLVALSFIPVIAGALRLHQLGIGVVTTENLRFFNSPVPVVLHIIGVTLFSLLGAFQFSSRFRFLKPNWHRQAGKILIVACLISSVTGLWMTQFYPSIKNEGSILYIIRIIVGVCMTLFILLGIDSIRRKNFLDHGKWMIRSYALGIGAGTQVLTHIPWFIFPKIQSEFTRALFMTLGWVINIIAAEWIIKKTITTKRKNL